MAAKLHNSQIPATFQHDFARSIPDLGALWFCDSFRSKGRRMVFLATGHAVACGFSTRAVARVFQMVAVRFWWRPCMFKYSIYV